MMCSQKKSITLIVFFLSIFLTACNDPELNKKLPSQFNGESLLTSIITIEKLPVNYRTTGSVVSDQRIEVASRTTGYIRKILVREGDLVKKGQPLIMLDDSDVEGAIKQVLANVNKSESALKDAQTDLNRFESLFKRGSVSENKLRKIRLQRDIAQNTLDEARAALQIAESQRQYTQIISLINGVVVARQKREGDLATPAVPLLTIESSEGLLFETYVAEGQLKNIKHGDPVKVVIDALKEPQLGTIARIVPSANPLTRKSLVKVSLSDDMRLLPGMFGRTYFKVGSRSRPVVDIKAVMERGGLDGVFIVDKENTIHFRWLQLGKVFNNKIEVLAGLKGAEHIIARSNDRLRDGQIIKVKGVNP